MNYVQWIEFNVLLNKRQASGKKKKNEWRVQYEKRLGVQYKKLWHTEDVRQKKKEEAKRTQHNTTRTSIVSHKQRHNIFQSNSYANGNFLLFMLIKYHKVNNKLQTK